MTSRTGIITLCGMALLCAAAAGCGNMANRAGSAGASNVGTSGNSLEGNGARSYDAQDKAMDRDKSGGTWQDRRQEQRQQRDDTGRTSGNSASTGTTGSSATSTDDRVPGGAKGDTQMSWRGTVLAIEPLSRQEAHTGIGISGAPGAAAAGGVVPGTGAAMGTVYRVTLRTDDGGSQAVIVENAPTYRIGDSVTYRNGIIQRQ